MYTIILCGELEVCSWLLKECEGFYEYASLGSILLEHGCKQHEGLHQPLQNMILRLCCTYFLLSQARYRRLPTKATRFFEVLSAGVPAVLVLWAPIVQLWTSCWSPANADLVQICTGLLAILSNCASLPLTQSKHQTLWTF